MNFQGARCLLHKNVPNVRGMNIELKSHSIVETSLYAWKQNCQQLQIYTKTKFNNKQVLFKLFNSKDVTGGCGVIFEFVKQHA
jgi:hypothetical protein